MDARKKKLVVIIALGGLFIFWRAHGLYSKYSPEPAPAAAGVTDPIQVVDTAPPESTVSAIEPSQDSGDDLKAQRFVEAQPWGRDPFDPAPFENSPETKIEQKVAKIDAPAPPPPAIVLTGVSKAGNRWLAAAGGGILTVGDTVQEHYHVAEITKSSITLTSEGWAFRFELGEKIPAIRPWTEKP